MGEAAYTYLADHATKRVVIDVPAYGRATVTVRVSGVDAAAAIAAIDVVARPQATLDLALALDSLSTARASWAPCCGCALTSTPPST